jgi:hypothetical protein
MELFRLFQKRVVLTNLKDNQSKDIQYNGQKKTT